MKFILFILGIFTRFSLVVKYDTQDLDKNPTLLNLMDGLDGNGNEIHIVEAMEKAMPLLDILSWQEANGSSSHMVGKRISKPRALRQRRIHRGNKTWHTVGESRKETLDDFEEYVEVDAHEMNRAPNAESYRIGEIKAHAENMGEQVSVIAWYGSRFDTENDIIGFANRYNDVSMSNVADAGGTTGLGSIWLVEPDPKELSFLYPKGHSSLGITETDEGRERVTDSDGNPYRAYSTTLGVSFGINSSNDDRIARLCNISIKDVEDYGGVSTDDMLSPNQFRKLVQLKNRLRGKGKNASLICSPEIKTQIDIWASEKSNLCLYKQDLQTGVNMAHFLDMPVLQDNTLLITEEQVV